MKPVDLTLQSRDSGAQALDSVVTQGESAFITNVAFPQLDAISKSETLEKFCDVVWNLCLWEQQRTNSIDTKAAALTGLWSLAAAVVSASANAAPLHRRAS